MKVKVFDYLTLKIMKFRSRQAAQDYLKFQREGGVPMPGAHVRMRKYKDHEWANRVGNVAVIKVSHDSGGDSYLFEDGKYCYEFLDNTEEIK